MDCPTHLVVEYNLTRASQRCVAVDEKFTNHRIRNHPVKIQLPRVAKVTVVRDALLADEFLLNDICKKNKHINKIHLLQYVSSVLFKAHTKK